MSRLSDPTICPDCRAPLRDQRECTGCGLRLEGADAATLWEHLVRADLLIEQLRRAPGPAAAPAAVPDSADAPPVARPSLTRGLPAAPRPASAPDRVPSGSAVSAQAILLGVGGLCLLVAAAVFIAVTWSDLGLAGRTLVMTVLTVVAAAVARLVTRKGLRGSAETLWLLTFALIAIDVVAARIAGLLGELDERHVGGLLGAVLLVTAVAVRAWAGTTPTRVLVGPVAVAGAGTLLLVSSEAWAAPAATVSTAASVPVLALVSVALSRVTSLRPVAVAVVVVGVLDWAVLVTQGADRAGAGFTQWWSDLRGWPLLVAALWAAVPAMLAVVPRDLRYVASSASLGSLIVLALGGQPAGDEARFVLIGVIAVVLAGLAVATPEIWARPASVAVALAAIPASGYTLLRPLVVIDLLPTTGPASSPGLGQHLPATTFSLAPWTAPATAAVAVITLLALLRFTPDPLRPGVRDAVGTAAPVLLGLGAATLLLEHRPQLPLAALALTGVVVIAGVACVLRRAGDAALITGLALSGYTVALDLRLGVASHLLAAVLAAVVAAVLVAALLRADPGRLHGALLPALAGAAVFSAGFAATHVPYLVGGRGDAAGISLVGVMAAAGLGAAVLGRTSAARVAVEATALAGAAAALAFPSDVAVTTAILTIAGAAIALVSVVHDDRAEASWLAVGVLGVATVLRIDQDVAAPELVGVPAAVVLLSAGIRRMSRDPEVGSWRALSSGLSLGLVPSLVLALDEPVSLRGALIAAAGVAVLGVGIVRHWGAPFLAGAGVVAVLALRHLGPVAAALPRWISLGSVGVVLLVIGISWEARRRDAAAAQRYLAALR